MTPLRFAVIGDPVAHSKSPVMHRAALRALGLPHTYKAIRVTADELPGVVQALRDGTFAGLNITVPHKQRVLDHVDGLDESARTAGAANTLVRTGDGRVVAHNTDVAALVAELTALAGPGAAWPTWRVLVLGSGGAALAARAALASLGAADIRVRARRKGEAWQPLEPSPSSERMTHVIVQATSAGMSGADPGEPVAAAVAWDALPPGAIALDVVYSPPETPFLAAARRRGLKSANGLGMLARQGALALELWLGGPAPLGAMLAALQGP